MNSLVRPCTRCYNPNVDAVEKPVCPGDTNMVTDFECAFCGLEHTIPYPLETAVRIWNEHPRPPSQSEAMIRVSSANDVLAARSSDRLERLVEAILQCGRVPNEPGDQVDDNGILILSREEQCARVVHFAEGIDRCMRIAEDERKQEAEASRLAASAAPTSDRVQ